MMESPPQFFKDFAYLKIDTEAKVAEEVADIIIKYFDLE